MPTVLESPAQAALGSWEAREFFSNFLASAESGAKLLLAMKL
jgi:hypothetical protein